MRDNDLMSWYTVYNAKTDEIVACGTADMIVRQMGYVNKRNRKPVCDQHHPCLPGGI